MNTTTTTTTTPSSVKRKRPWGWDRSKVVGWDRAVCASSTQVLGGADRAIRSSSLRPDQPRSCTGGNPKTKRQKRAAAKGDQLRANIARLAASQGMAPLASVSNLPKKPRNRKGAK